MVFIAFERTTKILLKTMDKIDREFFYAGWRLHFGKLQQPLVDRVNYLLDKFDASTVFDTKAKISYALATIKRETAETYAPVKEGYWITKNRVQSLYNYYYKNNRAALKTIFPAGLAGTNYLGRGYVQATHNYNAQKLQNRTGKPYLSNPDLLLEPDNAFEAMEVGMNEGIYTGKKLSNYFTDGAYDFYGARRIINGLDAAKEIADNAEIFFNIIKFENVEN